MDCRQWNVRIGKAIFKKRRERNERNRLSQCNKNRGKQDERNTQARITIIKATAKTKASGQQNERRRAEQESGKGQEHHSKTESLKERAIGMLIKFSC